MDDKPSYEELEQRVKKLEKNATTIGAADYIEKPIDQYDFAFKVRKVLDKKKV
jgi:hypothetical protein